MNARPGFDDRFAPKLDAPGMVKGGFARYFSRKQ